MFADFYGVNTPLWLISSFPHKVTEHTVWNDDLQRAFYFQSYMILNQTVISNASEKVASPKVVAFLILLKADRCEDFVGKVGIQGAGVSGRRQMHSKEAFSGAGCPALLDWPRSHSETTSLRLALTPCTGTGAQPKPRMGLEPVAF